MYRDAGSVEAEHLVERRARDLELAPDPDRLHGEGAGGDLQVGGLAVDAEQFGGLGHRVGAALASDGRRFIWWIVLVIGHGAQLAVRFGEAAMPPTVPGAGERR
jgi:hypothetical protein